VKKIILSIMILFVFVYSDEPMTVILWTGINNFAPINFDQIVGTTFRDDSIFVYHYKRIAKWKATADIIITSTKGGNITIDTLPAVVDSGFVQNPIVYWPILP